MPPSELLPQPEPAFTEASPCLGPVRLLRALGSGSMGTVHLAEMAEDRSYAPRGALVAVKLLHPDLLRSASGVAQRLLREAELGSVIDHPTVVRTHEVQRVETGGAERLFLIQELVVGRSLRELMAELRLLPEALLRDIGGQVAAGLAAIHAAGAVHRDIKPENLLITPDDQVKIMDLGLAALLDGRGGLTSLGQFVGSPLYAAPEQFGSDELGPAADLYALGVVLYEAATGRQPFAARGHAAVMRRQLEHVPERASLLNPELSPFFDELLGALLDKDPRRRPGPAGDLAKLFEEGEGSPWWHDQAQRRAAGSDVLRSIRVPRETEAMGRESEMARLQVALARSRAGRGGVLVVEGEAGIGKTRLLHEFVRRLRESDPEAAVLYGSNAPGGLASGPGAVAQAVLDHLGVEDLAARIERHVNPPSLAPAFAAHLAGQAAPPGCEPLTAGAPQGLFSQLARSLAEGSPLVWIVEDLHFGSADDAETLLALARVAVNTRFLLIATTRPGATAMPAEEILKMEGASRVTLGRISGDAVAAIVRQAVGSDPTLQEVAAHVARESAGNPFLALELLRELRERGIVTRDPDGVYRCRAAPAGAPAGSAGGVGAVFPVPPSVRALVRTRLDDLGEEDRALLDVGCVEGRAFDPDLIARVLGRRRLDVLQALSRIERRSGLLRVTGGGFEFEHHLVREAVYEGLPPALRREYHGHIAASFAEREGWAGRGPAEVPGEAAIFLAEHYLRGGAGEPGVRLAARAIAHLAQSHRSRALLELAALARESLRPEDSALLAEIRMQESESLQVMGRWEEARAATAEALGAAVRSGDTELAVRGRLQVAEQLVQTAEYGAALEALEEVLGAALRGGYRLIAGRCEVQLARIHVNRGDYVMTREHLDRALVLCTETGDRDSETWILSTLGCVHVFLGNPGPAEENLTRSLELARSRGDQIGSVRALGNLGLLYLTLGRFEEAMRVLKDVLDLNEQLGTTRTGSQGNAHANLGEVYTQIGSYGKARYHVGRSLVVSQESGSRHNHALGLARLGFIAYYEGRLDEAREHFTACRALGEAIRTQRVQALSLSGLGQVAAAAGEAEAASRLLEEALRMHRALGTLNGIAETATVLGRVCLERGQRAAARAHFEEARDIVERTAGAEPGPVPAAYLALLGEADPGQVEIPARYPLHVRAEAHLVLHCAGAGKEHLAMARELLEGASSHLAGEDLARFWEANPIARGVRLEEGRGRS